MPFSLATALFGGGLFCCEAFRWRTNGWCVSEYIPGLSLFQSRSCLALIWPSSARSVHLVTIRGCRLVGFREGNALPLTPVVARFLFVCRSFNPRCMTGNAALGFPSRSGFFSPYTLFWRGLSLRWWCRLRSNGWAGWCVLRLQVSPFVPRSVSGTLRNVLFPPPALW